MLLESDDAVITSELTRVELAGAVRFAERSGRLRKAKTLLDRIEAHCSDDGPLLLVRLDAASAIPTARVLVLEHRLRTLDALHLATALTAAVTAATSEEFVFVTRGQDQAAAASAVGLTVG